MSRSYNRFALLLGALLSLLLVMTLLYMLGMHFLEGKPRGKPIAAPSAAQQVAYGPAQGVSRGPW